MQLSIIIVSYNVKYYLEQCLHSILIACKNIEAEIIVIDNNSKDKTAEYIQSKFPAVIFIQESENIGFAKANNIGLSVAKGEFILYLNPDTIVSENAIINCISFLNEHQEAGAVGVKMIDDNGNFLPESKRAFPSTAASFWKLTGMAKLFPHSSIFNKYALGNLNEDEVHEVDVLSGAFFLSRKEILKKLNGFDEDFFMYGEDIDLSYRIQKTGYKNYYLGNNSVIHFKGKSTKKDKAFVKNFYGAMKIFVDKHYKKFSSLFIKTAISGGAFVSTLRNNSKQLSNPIEQNEKALFVLCGDADAIKSAAEILSANNYNFETVITNSLSNDSKLLNLSSSSNIIFCLHHLTCSNCIQFVHDNKNRFIYYWHYKNSQSIISGSNGSAISQIYIPI